MNHHKASKESIKSVKKTIESHQFSSIFKIRSKKLIFNSIFQIMSDGEWQTAGGASGNRPEPSFEDPEGFVDDISNEELMPDIMARAPREADGIENVVIISNIPKTAKVSKI